MILSDQLLKIKYIFVAQWKICQGTSTFELLFWPFFPSNYLPTSAFQQIDWDGSYSPGVNQSCDVDFPSGLALCEDTS